MPKPARPSLEQRGDRPLARAPGLRSRGSASSLRARSGRPAALRARRVARSLASASRRAPSASRSSPATPTPSSESPTHRRPTATSRRLSPARRSGCTASASVFVPWRQVAQVEDLLAGGTSRWCRTSSLAPADRPPFWSTGRDSAARRRLRPRDDAPPTWRKPCGLAAVGSSSGEAPPPAPREGRLYRSQVIDRWTLVGAQRPCGAAPASRGSAGACLTELPRPRPIGPLRGVVRPGGPPRLGHLSACRALTGSLTTAGPNAVGPRPP